MGRLSVWESGLARTLVFQSCCYNRISWVWKRVCNPGTGKVEAGASLGYIVKSCFKNEQKANTNTSVWLIL